MSNNTDQPFDGKTLWNATIEIDVVVLAKTRRDAERIVADESDEISRSIDRDMISASSSEITIMDKKRWSIPNAWEDSEPYGGSDGKTCQQIIEAIEEYRRLHPSAAELEAAGQGVLQGCK